jgi:hypothetical protein
MYIFHETVRYLELPYATPPCFRPLVLDLRVPPPRDGGAVPP